MPIVEFFLMRSMLEVILSFRSSGAKRRGQYLERKREKKKKNKKSGTRERKKKNIDRKINYKNNSYVLYI
jgi:hypothetical protein